MKYNTGQLGPWHEYGQTKYVTPTGRAKSPGRATRATTARCAHGAPLPVHLACHPKALTPTSHNPACVTAKTAWGESYLRHKAAAATRGAGYFNLRTWSNSLTRKFALYVQSGRPGLARTTDDLNEALGWKHAAADYGVHVDIYYNNP